MNQPHTTFPVFRMPTLDLTTDETHVLVSGLVEDGNVVRIPMTVTTAMQLLKLLDALRQDKGLALPSSPVDIDKVQ